MSEFTPSTATVSALFALSGPRRLLIVVAALLIFAVACGDAGSDGVSAEDRAEIEALLDAYLPRLAEAYRTGDIEVLRGYATEKEMATLYKLISDLMAEKGRFISSELKSYEIEEIKIWNHANAFVRTSELWDVQTVASGSDTVMSEMLDQRHRVVYQLKRTDEGWRVILRNRQASETE